MFFGWWRPKIKKKATGRLRIYILIYKRQNCSPFCIYQYYIAFYMHASSERKLTERKSKETPMEDCLFTITQLVKCFTCSWMPELSSWSSLCIKIIILNQTTKLVFFFYNFIEQRYNRFEQFWTKILSLQHVINDKHKNKHS